MSRSFGDVEAAVVAYLDTAVAAPRVATWLPPDLETHLPMVRVTAVGGIDDKITDTVRVDIETFAGTRAASVDLAETVRQAMHTLAHSAVTTATGVVQVDSVETLTRPFWVDYQNVNVQRFTATYEVRTRIRVS